MIGYRPLSKLVYPLLGMVLGVGLRESYIHGLWVLFGFCVFWAAALVGYEVFGIAESRR